MARSGVKNLFLMCRRCVHHFVSCAAIIGVIMEMDPKCPRKRFVNTAQLTRLKRCMGCYLYNCIVEATIDVIRMPSTVTI